MANTSKFTENELAYMEGLRRVPRLTPEEEISLITRFLKDGDEEAKMRFVEASFMAVMEARLQEG